MKLTILERVNNKILNTPWDTPLSFTYQESAAITTGNTRFKPVGEEFTLENRPKIYSLLRTRSPRTIDSQISELREANGIF
jgi:hypothetical protein